MELEHPRYPWKIRVTAQVPAQGCLAGVTVEDVFTAIFENLRTDVEAYSVWGTSDAIKRFQASVVRTDSKYSRYSRLKRLHWLGTRSVHFLGISADKQDPARWYMHFSHDDLPERPLPPLPLDDEPPEYELSSSNPSFIVLEQEGIFRAVRIEPYRYQSDCPPPVRERKYPRRQRVLRHPIVL